ncbi:MAG: carbohydrate-binding family 9-like protein [bacterium]
MSILKKSKLVAIEAKRPVRLDGMLGDPVWKDAQAYPLSLSLPRLKQGATVQERGTVKAVWSRQHLYIGVDFQDSDVVAEGASDGLHHYSLGDTAEVFLWPEEYTWYWELYATPAGRQTSFFFPGGGRLGLPSHFCQNFRFKVKTHVEGVLNDWRIPDKGWSAELAVPVKALTALGEAWGPGSRWRILVSRYNYSRCLTRKELTMYPALPVDDFHARDHYAQLIFGSHKS